MDFFNKYKKLLIGLFATVAIFYAVFLLVIPNAINLNIFKKDIQKIVFDMAKLDIDFGKAKIVTTPTLKVGLKVADFNLCYPSKISIASVGNAEFKISLLPLLLKTLHVSDISVDTPVLNLVYTKDGQIDLVKYILQELEQQNPTSEQATAELPIKISNKLPVVKVKNYNVRLVDEKTKANIEVKGDNFVFDNAEINKHLRLMTNGSVFFNEGENITYDVKLSSFWPVMEEASNQSVQAVELPYVDFINELVKFSPKTNVKADLKIYENAGQIGINGLASVDNVSIVLDGKRLPDSFVRMQSAGHKTNISSELAITTSEKALINANLEHGKKLKADVNFKAEKITFSALQKYLAALLNSFHIKNDILDFNVVGYLSSDFSLKTDMKKLESSGYFRVLDGDISHKKIPLRIKNLIADLDFSNNSLKFKKAGLGINDTLVAIKGGIDSKANADIVVTTGKINIAPLFNAFAPMELKNSLILQSGILGANVLVKGNLSKIEPSLDVSLNNFALKDKANTFLLTDNSTVLNLKAKGSSFDGEVLLNNAAFKMSNPSVKLNLPIAKIKINPNDITIIPFDVTMNSSKVTVSGSIKDYLKKMDINVFANGKVVANDIRSLLPKEARSFVSASGAIPLKAILSGSDKKLVINAQAQTSSNNHFSPITIKKMQGNAGLLNAELTYSNDNLSVDDIALYQVSGSTFGDDFSLNKKGAIKIAGLSGVISSLSAAQPTMKVVFTIPEQLVLSNIAMPKASLAVNGSINILGSLLAPSFKGSVLVKDVNIPELLTKVQNVDIQLNGNMALAKVLNLDINGTSMNIDAEASTSFTNVFLVKSMKLMCDNFDVDNLFKAMDKMMAIMPASPAPSTLSATSTTLVAPVKISNGSIDIKNFKMKQIGGDFIAKNITGTFCLVNDLFKLSNLKATVYNGLVTGLVTYHLATTAVSADVKGKGVNANPAVTVFVGLKDQLLSNVDFNANVKLKGATYEQQMKSLNGTVDFSMKDGQVGSLGRLETFLKADNLLSQGFISTQIGSLINKVAPYNTGKFSYLNGDLTITNGVAKLNSIKMSGPHMSLLIMGNVNVLSMISSMNILGSISPEMNSVLGPITNLSVEKFAAYIPKFGTKIASALNTYNAPLKEAELAKIPPLSPAKDGIKAFKVVLNGNLNNPPSAIKKFQWLNTPEKIQEEQKVLTQEVASQSQSTSQNVIPTTKEALKESVKGAVQNQLENNEKVQEIKQNKTVKTLTGIYNFYKQSQTQTGTTTSSVEAQ